jgi:hypothetical protein
LPAQSLEAAACPNSVSPAFLSFFAIAGGRRWHPALLASVEWLLVFGSPARARTPRRSFLLNSASQQFALLVMGDLAYRLDPRPLIKGA